MHQCQRMSLSTFTEKYPARFARQIAKVLLYQATKDRPILAMNSQDSADEHASSEEHPTKKRRVGKKMSPPEIAHRFADIKWQIVMQRADQLLQE